GASAATSAELASGVKDVLCGAFTGLGLPGLPVVGSIGVSAPSVRPSALLATQSVRRSQEGTTCCGLTPTLKRSTTLNVAGSITYTSFDLRFGTYTRSSAPLTAALILPLAVSL